LILHTNKINKLYIKVYKNTKNQSIDQTHKTLLPNNERTDFRGAEVRFGGENSQDAWPIKR
jgi:hypothetical protein